ncbi:MAG: hypothetical protein D3913_08000 [Candidatus Electrothrix sp. LOE1_4_5]|nr:hypothetical protein [Candidatus Electrothrix gigas]MCI5179579.1 hypothetical protein [Candidatus Electrothrix gigas]MCI5197115.1 hypothetical protein [Candidatus Electrothrix gigas]MCI5227192.1 hypothetical protein [Candidatus Electrothrix gigas]
MNEERTKEIIELARSFGTRYLNEELIACTMRLCIALGQNRKVTITRGKKEIWAASIVYVIARANFLFDKKNENFLTADVICDFFGTNKTTTANKATVIEKTLNISVADKRFCTDEIIDSLSFVVTKGGYLLPKKRVEALVEDLVDEVIYEMADEEESKEIEQFMAEKKKQEEAAAQAKKERRAEINREIAEKKRKKKEEEQAKKNGRQLKLW